MKNILIIIALSVPIYTQAQYTDVGLSIGKFRSMVQFNTGIYNTKQTCITGISVSAGINTQASFGPMCSLELFRSYILTTGKSGTSIAMRSTMGGHVSSIYKYYYMTNNWKGAIPYNDAFTTSMAITTSLGLEAIFTEWPVTIAVAAQPYYEVVNPGLEWIDFWVSFKYQIANN